MKISVIIPTLNSAGHIAERLKPIFTQNLPKTQYEILVVDNGSDDNTTEILTSLSYQINNLRWVREPTRGRAQARNRGICESTGDLIVFLDDDIEVAADLLERHQAYHFAANRPVAVLGHVTDASLLRPKWLQDYYHARQRVGSSAPNLDSVAPQGFGFVTGNVSLLRSTLELVKRAELDRESYFDPSLVYRQDAELGMRLVKAGVQFIFASDIRCYHRHSRNLRTMLKRSYHIGYYTEVLIQKHSEISSIERYLTKSRLVNFMLLMASIGLFWPAYILHFVWPEPLYKVTGGILLYQTNRGYQQALRDHGKETS